MEMKTICLMLILALMFILGISVNAEAGYTPGINSYTDSMTDGEKTAFIYKGSEQSDKYLPRHRWIIENIESPTAIFVGLKLPYHGLNIACKGLCTKGHLKGFCILYGIMVSDLPTHRLYPKICFLYRYRRLGYERRKS